MIEGFENSRVTIVIFNKGDPLIRGKQFENWWPKRDTATARCSDTHP
jgi:hypothetical protein